MQISLNISFLLFLSVMKVNCLSFYKSLILTHIFDIYTCCIYAQLLNFSLPYNYQLWIFNYPFSRKWALVGSSLLPSMRNGCHEYFSCVSCDIMWEIVLGGVFSNYRSWYLSHENQLQKQRRFRSMWRLKLQASTSSASVRDVCPSQVCGCSVGSHKQDAVGITKCYWPTWGPHKRSHGKTRNLECQTLRLRR